MWWLTLLTKDWASQTADWTAGSLMDAHSTWNKSSCWETSRLSLRRSLLSRSQMRPFCKSCQAWSCTKHQESCSLHKRRRQQTRAFAVSLCPATWLVFVIRLPSTGSSWRLPKPNSLVTWSESMLKSPPSQCTSAFVTQLKAHCEYVRETMP